MTLKPDQAHCLSDLVSDRVAPWGDNGQLALKPSGLELSFATLCDGH